MTKKDINKIRAIKGAITRHIRLSMNSENPRLSNWYCGITNDVNRRKAEHNAYRGLVNFWHCYDAGSVSNANIIEAAMSEKGMINRPHIGGAIRTSRWVYVFKEPRTIGLNGIDDVLKQLFS